MADSWRNTRAPVVSDQPWGGDADDSTLCPKAATTNAAPTAASALGRSNLREAGTRAAPATAAASAVDAPLRPTVRAASTKTTPPPTTAAPPAPSMAGGAAAAASATERTHHSSAAVGRWTSHASRSPRRPAPTPPVRPHIITGADAGPAATLAGSDASGTVPKTATSSGITASWAPAVVAVASRSGRGPGSISASAGVIHSSPQVAHTDSWKASTRTRKGSATSTAATAQARVRRPDSGRPRAALVTATPAMAAARSTDGSKRVSSANTPSRASNTTRRTPGRARTIRGEAKASTKATFWPDTTSRWPSPAARKSSDSRGDWLRSSP